MNLPRPLPFDRHDSVVRVFVVHLAGLGGLTADQTLVFKDQLRQCSIGQISTRPCPALNGGLCNFIIVAHPCIRAIGRCNLLYTAGAVVLPLGFRYASAAERRGLVTQQEYEAVTQFHKSLEAYSAPENDEFDHAAILDDPAWQSVVHEADDARSAL